MNILLVMIPLSIVLLAVAALAFSWAVDHDQLEDFDHAQFLPLLDQPEKARAEEEQAKP